MIDESIDKVNGRAKQAAGVRSGNKRLDNEGTSTLRR
jgi:uncharacterized protein YjbJ (UPF0337 family)